MKKKAEEQAIKIYNKFFALTPEWLENDEAIHLAKLNSLMGVKLVLSTDLYSEDRDFWINVYDKIEKL
jgi:hypothetical protein